MPRSPSQETELHELSRHNPAQTRTGARLAWFPNGKRILFEGNEPSRPLRLYVQRIDGGPPTPLTPEGTSFLGHFGQHPISPDGKSIIAYSQDGSVAIYNVEDGSSHPFQGLGIDGRFIRWTSASEVMYVRRIKGVGRPIIQINRLNIVTGQRSLWKEIPIVDPSGFFFHSILLTPDEKSYFYTYSRELSTLFLADGLK